MRPRRIPPPVARAGRLPRTWEGRRQGRRLRRLPEEALRHEEVLRHEGALRADGVRQTQRARREVRRVPRRGRVGAAQEELFECQEGKVDGPGYGCGGASAVPWSSLVWPRDGG